MITLPIKKKWFDMILSGKKKEEYRKISPHYASLFNKYKGVPVRIRFRNGYRLDSPTLECTVIPRIGYGREEWGAEANKGYYVLDIHDNPELLGGDNND